MFPVAFPEVRPAPVKLVVAPDPVATDEGEVGGGQQESQNRIHILFPFKKQNGDPSLLHPEAVFEKIDRRLNGTWRSIA